MRLLQRGEVMLNGQINMDTGIIGGTSRFISSHYYISDYILFNKRNSKTYTSMDKVSQTTLFKIPQTNEEKETKNEEKED